MPGEARSEALRSLDPFEKLEATGDTEERGSGGLTLQPWPWTTRHLEKSIALFTVFNYDQVSNDKSVSNKISAPRLVTQFYSARESMRQVYIVCHGTSIPGMSSNNKVWLNSH